MVRKGKLIPAIYGCKRLIVEKLSLEKISLFCVDRLENYMQQKIRLSSKNTNRMIIIHKFMVTKIIHTIGK